MQKFIAAIIVLLSVITSTNTTFAKQGYLEELLDLNYGPEEYQITLSSLDNQYFTQSDTQEYFIQVDSVNELLKDEILKQYKSWKLDHNQMSGIISAHQKFVYHLNNLFQAINMKESGLQYVELDDYVIDSYKGSRIYYKKIKKIIAIK